MENFKKAVNYFKKWESTGVLGIGMMAVGVLFMWLGYSYFSYISAIVLIVGGIGVFLYGNIGRGSESDINDRIKQETEKINFKELEENTSLRKRTPKNPEEMTFECFEMRDGLLFKKKKDASVISSEYTCIKLTVLSDAFYIKRSTFSLISEEKQTETVDVRFDEITDISVERNVFMVGTGEKKQHRVRTCFVVISYGNSQKVRLPKKDDAYVEEFANALKKKCGK
ncbi:MAG: DUF308 domain-containing protein [Clostridia bacterium]|nr:DUF308 domain-containing protein [Clostridia bacterium]